MKKLFLALAALLTVTWFALRLAGFARYVSVLSGTIPEGATSTHGATFWCAAYVLAHFAFVLGVPALILATGLVGLYERARRGTDATHERT